ncbi:hypothetical protein A2U01_0086471, partial [Trifolium medium]|nr:hypothetical protein [Trifolium medium]
MSALIKQAERNGTLHGVQ